MSDNLEINKREYPSNFSKTAIVICLDGSQKEYLEEASKSNLTPNLDKLIAINLSRFGVRFDFDASSRYSF